MKNLALIFVLFVVTIANASAMPSKKQQPTERKNRIPVVLYTVKLNPPVDIFVAPSKKKIKFAGFVAREIDIDCNNYNGLPVFSPIRLHCNMSLNEIVDSLCKSFRVEWIEWREGYMSKTAFSRMFSPFKVKL